MHGKTGRTHREAFPSPSPRGDGRIISSTGLRFRLAQTGPDGSARLFPLAIVMLIRARNVRCAQPVLLPRRALGMGTGIGLARTTPPASIGRRKTEQVLIFARNEALPWGDSHKSIQVQYRKSTVAYLVRQRIEGEFGRLALQSAEEPSK